MDLSALFSSFTESSLWQQTSADQVRLPWHKGLTTNVGNSFFEKVQWCMFVSLSERETVQFPFTSYKRSVWHTSNIVPVLEKSGPRVFIATYCQSRVLLMQPKRMSGLSFHPTVCSLGQSALGPQSAGCWRGTFEKIWYGEFGLREAYIVERWPPRHKVCRALNPLFELGLVAGVLHCVLYVQTVNSNESAIKSCDSAG